MEPYEKDVGPYEDPRQMEAPWLLSLSSLFGVFSTVLFLIAYKLYFPAAKVVYVTWIIVYLTLLWRRPL